MKVTAFVALAAALLVVGCTSAPAPTASRAPTASPAPTATAAPSATPTAAQTPEETASPARTDSPAPIDSPAPSATATTSGATTTPSLAGFPEEPGVCAEADLIFDPVTQELLLVNCTTYSGGPTVLTVWGWTGNAWHEVTTPGPAPARVVGGAALDTARDVLTVYGGYVPGVDPCSTETWEWDRTTWTQIDADAPPACDHMKMIYDPDTRQTLLMGGQDAANAGVDQTWAWDGTTWQQVDAAQPPSRAHFGLQYVPSHEQVLLYGGLTTAAVLGDFWTRRFGHWQPVSLVGLNPGPRSHLRMAYDTTTNELLMFGGATSDDSYGSLTNETWLLTGGAWQQLFPATSPTARGSASLGYDPVRDQIVLYGGFDATQAELDDTWLWDGQNWSCVANCP